jgi:ubiquitin C-terminal hydrolase
MQKVFYEAAKKKYADKQIALPLHADETTLVNRIFGGYLESTVTCSQCRSKSTRSEPFLDLHLVVPNTACSLYDALDQVLTTEELSGSNQYQCEKFSSILIIISLLYI